ncbi:MAG: ABC transporter permease [Bacteroidota bacterium]
MEHRPPKRALEFLRWFCKEEHLEEIEGNLLELYELNAAESERKANRAFYKDVLLHFRPTYIRSFTFFIRLNNTHMLKNYVKIAFRNFVQNPLYALLNVFGLSIGITFSLLLLLGIYDHLTIDRFHTEGDQIYTAYFHGLEEDGSIPFVQGTCPYALYTTLQEVAGVEKTVYVEDWWGDMMLEKDGKLYKENGVCGTPSMFNIFSFPLVEGTIENTRSNQQTVFLSSDAATRMFGRNWAGKVIGKTITINDEYEVTVAGIFENIPKKSSFRFDVLLNVETLLSERGEAFLTNWGWKSATVYTKLAKNVDPKAVADQINPIYAKAKGHGVGGDAVLFFPFEDNFLYTQFENGIAVGGQIDYVKIFLGAALFLILIACINFINLSTAQASKRAKEVGIRKTVGAEKSSLVFQFLTETGLLIFLTTLLSLVAAYYFVPSINELTDKNIHLPLDNPLFWGILLTFGGVLTLLAGLYPSFVLSSFNPINALKSGPSSRFAHEKIRKGLVVFQFVLSATLIISTIVVNNQIHYIKNKNFGLNRNNIIHFSLPDAFKDKYQPLKNQLESNSAITHVLKTTSLPTDVNSIGVGYTWEGMDDPEDGGYYYQLYTEFGFEEVFGIEMREGRFFDKNIQSDVNGVVINEKALDFINLENPVGKVITQKNDGQQMTILGIVKNFPFKGLHKEVEPLMIHALPEVGDNVIIKSTPEETANTIALLEKSWKEVIPNYPLEFNFLDDTYAKMYQSETAIGTISQFMATIAIIISCLGLFGLVTFTAAQRAKEIGIRKVLGASSIGILELLSKDLMKLILIGLAIAIPFSWLGTNEWLQGYAFRVELEWWMFAIAALITVVIALATVSFQSIRAAWVNPVEVLKRD